MRVLLSARLKALAVCSLKAVGHNRAELNVPHIAIRNGRQYLRAGDCCVTLGRRLCGSSIALFDRAYDIGVLSYGARFRTVT